LSAQHTRENASRHALLRLVARFNQFERILIL
jgi:hypothetical protein